MFIGVGARCLDFNPLDLHTIRYFNPRIASQLKRIHGVCNHGSTDSEVILGDCVGDAVSCIIERLVNDTGSSHGLFDRIDAQVHCADQTSQLPRYGRLSKPQVGHQR